MFKDFKKIPDLPKLSGSGGSRCQPSLDQYFRDFMQFFWGGINFFYKTVGEQLPRKVDVPLKKK